ncbi:MAG TPA: carboxylating nicotinate-nucleotide diphosphorylase [Roseiflexaceae bacterium]|nr:carboxylating nicotinate-nucleotide diphosphorylase [Roseiflexaceae bacterium]
MDLSPANIREIVAGALREDIGHADLSSQATIPAYMQASAQFVMREPGVLAGLPLLAAVFAELAPALKVELCAADGDRVPAGAVVAQLHGSARAILAGERVALNLLQRLCGIATLTARYVAAIGDLPTRVLDTRKTTPGLRALEKYAVRAGGGTNHRFGLYDGIMLKDNHLALLEAEGVSLAEGVRRARAAVGPMVRIEVEVENVEDAIRAAEAGADMILLDNMALEDMRAAVVAVGGRAQLEASGGITLETIRAVAETGVDYISVGALTHSARALDISLEIVPSPNG